VAKAIFPNPEREAADITLATVSNWQLQSAQTHSHL